MRRQLGTRMAGTAAVMLALMVHTAAGSEEGCKVHVSLYWDEQQLETWENAAGSQTVLLSCGVTYGFAACCDCGHNVSLTSNFGKSDGPKTSCFFDKTFGTMSGDQNDKWVKAVCQETSQECLVEFTVVAVSFDSVGRVAPTKAASTQAHFADSLALSGGRQVGLEWARIYRTSGTLTDFSPGSMTETPTTVTYKGGQQSSYQSPNNIALEAVTDYDILAASETLTVCAHPKPGTFKLASRAVEALGYGGRVFFEVESDSGDGIDMNEIWLRERLSNFTADSPPFYVEDLPSIQYSQDRLSGAYDPSDKKCYPSDQHGMPKGNVRNYTDGHREYDQKVDFRCFRCLMADQEDEWQDVGGEWHIDFHVFCENGTWKIETKKSGTDLPQKNTEILDDDPGDP